MNGSQASGARDVGFLALFLIVVFMAAITMFIQSWGIINADVSFLAWTAREVLGPAVFGVDIYEVNPPLAFMIYTPAALISHLIGFDLAIKLWVTALGCLSVAMFWQTCDVRLRLPLSITLALFIALVLPEGFGQREQIAFMLTAPYVAGTCRNRAAAILIGVMAGIGFAIKPYFLIPLILVFATRRRIGIPEWAIAATGTTYAAVLLLFFQPYLFDFMPLARATYWAIHLNSDDTLYLAGAILLIAVPFSLAGAPQPALWGFSVATAGFTISALIQLKGFGYHFTPALGYLFLLLVGRAFNVQRVVGICAVFALLLLSYVFTAFAVDFFKPNKRLEIMARLLPEINRSESFLSFAIKNSPSFPAALYSSSNYMGISGWALFMKAARSPLSEPELREKLEQISISQAIRELERRPSLVIVERQGVADGWQRTDFDLLSLFKADAQFRKLWDCYSYDKTIGGYELYRRR